MSGRRGGARGGVWRTVGDESEPEHPLLPQEVGVRPWGLWFVPELRLAGERRAMGRGGGRAWMSCRTTAMGELMAVKSP